MTTDSIVQEVRNHREQIARECDYDLHKIFACVRAMSPMKLDLETNKTNSEKNIQPAFTVDPFRN